jgi:hypothetical protein
MGWLSQSETRSEKAQLRKALFGTKPIEPVYRRAADIGIGGVEMFINDRDRQFFRDFAPFAERFNREFLNSGDDFAAWRSWRIQELEDTELSWPGQDSPAYGCRYSVHYNQVQLGDLQISADAFDYSTDTPFVGVDLDLEYVRMLPFGHVNAFLHHLMGIVRPRPDYNSLQPQEMINVALLELLWPGKSDEEDADMYRSLDFAYSGSADRIIRSITSQREKAG